MAGRDYPAMAGIGVTRLWQKEAMIEIKGVAVIGSGKAPEGGTEAYVG